MLQKPKRKEKNKKITNQIRLEEETTYKNQILHKSGKKKPILKINMYNIFLEKCKIIISLRKKPAGHRRRPVAS